MFIFLIPLLFDYALGGIYFIVSYRLAAEGYPAFLSGSPMIVWGISYALSSIVVGRITTPANARVLLLLSGVGTVVTSLCFILFDNDAAAVGCSDGNSIRFLLYPVSGFCRF